MSVTIEPFVGRSQGGSVSYRPYHPSDADAVNALYVAEYGKAYPYLLRGGTPDGVHVVAESGGTIAGFARAASYMGHGSIWEFGGLIIRTEFRGRGIAAMLTDLRLEEVTRRGGIAAVSEPVCYRSDCASQANLVKHGFVLVGIEPFKYPDIKPELLGEQPESVVVAERSIVGDSGFGRRRIHLPPDYALLLTRYLPSYAFERGWGTQLEGSMPEPVVHEPYRGKTNVGSAFVDVPLNWHGSHDAINGFRARGFRFSGLLPGCGLLPDGTVFDFLRLYRPPPVAGLDFGRLIVDRRLEPLMRFMVEEASSS